MKAIGIGKHIIPAHSIIALRDTTNGCMVHYNALTKEGTKHLLARGMSALEVAEVLGWNVAEGAQQARANEGNTSV